MPLRPSSFVFKMFLFLPLSLQNMFVSLRPKPHRMWTVCTAIDRRAGGEHSDRSEAETKENSQN